MTPLEATAIFLGIPLALYLGITVIVMAFTSSRGGGVSELDQLKWAEKRESRPPNP
jgi:hypothetical protein